MFREAAINEINIISIIIIITTTFLLPSTSGISMILY